MTTATTTTAAGTAKTKPGRKTLRKAGRVKRNAKIVADKEFATKYFEGKSKRSADKKTAFRKRKAKK